MSKMQIVNEYYNDSAASEALNSLSLKDADYKY